VLPATVAGAKVEPQIGVLVCFGFHRIILKSPRSSGNGTIVMQEKENKSLSGLNDGHF
jgi:hypothetical protein